MPTEIEKEVAFIEYVAKSIVTRPEAVVVTRSVDDLGVLITLKVDMSDNGVTIGKQGATVNAMRTLLRVIGGQQKARINLKLDTPARDHISDPSLI